MAGRGTLSEQPSRSELAQGVVNEPKRCRRLLFHVKHSVGVRLEGLEGRIDTSQHPPEQVSRSPLKTNLVVSVRFDLVSQRDSRQQHRLRGRRPIFAGDFAKLRAHDCRESTQLVFGDRADDPIILARYP